MSDSKYFEHLGNIKINVPVTRCRFVFADRKGRQTGLIDECRVSNAAKSADWITFEYHNMIDSNHALTFGAEQSGGTIILNPAAPTWSDASNVLIQSAVAPTYLAGGIYYDTTLHKLRIGGASGWETITSV